jgi:nucleoid DNA-binding protein
MAKEPAKKAPSKSEVLANIATETGLSKKQVQAVLDSLSNEIGKALSKKGTGVFQVPGLVKIVRKEKPAQPARKGVMVLGQLRDLPAKPASKKVKVLPLKNLKAMVS